ncbi:hypothetical protein FGO68_gene10999 [Halteria grandinella]|uniref:TRP C-terminal domain-containing protein n=1 Tax=Halteria grandinella TaxID=5974 RepID=A0A8J8NF82_HALGN|nr:hypothetical protein FGO68_gene10999 [Halteria grandinella]
MIICANVGLTVAGGFSMKKLWQLISTLQILVHYPLLNLPMQANFLMVLKGIQDISNLNIIPKDKIKVFVNNIVADTQDGIEGSFGDMGYESSNTLHNMGLVAILIVATGILIAIIVVIGKVCRTSSKVQNLIQKIKTKLMFNPIIQAQLKGYIKLSLACLISLNNFATLTPGSRTANILLLVYFVAAPIGLFYFLKKQDSQHLRLPETKLKYASMLINLKTTSVYTLLYTTLYLYRRLFLVLTIVLFPNSQLTQASLALGCSLFMLVYLLHFKPHRSYNTRMFEIFNEFTILSVTYLTLMNADIVTDDLLRYNIGWVMVGIIGLCIFANLVNVLTNMGRKIYNKIKLLLIRKDVIKPPKAKPVQMEASSYSQISETRIGNNDNSTSFIQENPNSNLEECKDPVPPRPPHRLVQREPQINDTITDVGILQIHNDSIANLVSYQGSPLANLSSLPSPHQDPTITATPTKISLLKVRRERNALIEERRAKAEEEAKIASYIEEIAFANKLNRRANNVRDRLNLQKKGPQGVNPLYELK